MKNKAELREALKYIDDAIRLCADPDRLVMFVSMREVLRWTLGETGPFQKFIDPLRAIEARDKARPQAQQN